MPVMVTPVDDRGRVVVTVRGPLEPAEVLAVLRHIATVSSQASFIIDVTHAPEVSPVALAALRSSELWARISLWGLSHNGERLLRHLVGRARAAGA